MDEVLVRAADAGATYVAWRWLDDLDNPRAQRLDTAAVDAAIEQLDRALIALLPGETQEQAHNRAIRDGAFTTREGEHALAQALANAILPPALVAEIIKRAHPRVRVRLTPSPRLARVPWETLVVAAARRLLDVADIVYDPPATVRAERSVQPVPWAQRAAEAAIFVIDPQTTAGSLKSILAADGPAKLMFFNRVKSHHAARLADARNIVKAVAQRVRREDLAEWLRPPRSRLFYYGHVTAVPDEPGSASLHLSDEVSSVWGMASPVGTHVPLSALDLLLGTTTAPLEVRQRSGSEAGVAGHLLWPMPPRVAVIACEGGADFRSTETFGLVMAMLNAGAELVTTTRWIMPTDWTFWHHHPALQEAGVRPTTEFALTVDAAHAEPDAIGTLAAWQREQLNLWRDHGHLANTPLVWASAINTWAPAIQTDGVSA